MNATLKITTHGTLQFNSFFIITTGVGFIFRVYIRNKCFGTKKKKTFSYDCKQTDNFSDYCFNKKVSF